MKGWIEIRELPIGRKLILLLLFASTLALLATAVAVLVYEVRSFRPRTLERAETQAELYGELLHAPLNFQQPVDARKALAALAQSPDIQGACVYLNDRTEFARYERRREDEFRCPTLGDDSETRFDERELDLYHRITLEGFPVGTLFLRYDLPPLARRLPQYFLMVGAVLFALLTVSLLLLSSLKRTISTPILELAQAAGKVTEEEDYSVRVPETSGDEIGHLTSTFNRMLSAIQQRDAALRRANSEQKALQEQLIQAQKMESIGRLAGGVAHDFNNLLTVVVGCTELVRHQLEDQHSATPLLENIQQATRQATNLTNQLLAFARRQIIEPQVLSLNELVFDAEKMLRTLIGEHIELVVIPRPDLWPVKADPSQMMQVLVNLVVNARDAMPEGGTLTLETFNQPSLREGTEGSEDTLGDRVILSVRDTGMGLSEEARKHLFEPFFTTKERGKGTGLGLAMCYGIVTQIGGHIGVESQAGKGTCFEVSLRRAFEVRERHRTERIPANLAGGEETILVVEDNALVRVTAVELLRAQGYTVLEAAGGADALRLVEEYEGDLHLLVTDVVMPEMSGPEVARHVQDLRPGIRVLFVSGYTADEIGHRGELDPGMAFLQKPYTSQALIRKVRQMIDTR